MQPEPGAHFGVPVHLGLILDGNRRWARAQGLPQLEGHKRGYENLYRIVQAAAEAGVSYVSAYIFSTENWSRSQEEVDYLMDLLVWVATKEVKKYSDEGLRLVFLGARAGLPAKVLKAMMSAEEKTRHNAGMLVALCLNYGGQMELAEGVARMMTDGVKPDEVTPERVAEYLYHPEIPPVDFIIRTSGEQRLSGFMLWRASYAELYFTSVPWPAFTTRDFGAALAEYARRKRRFGK